MEIKAFRKPLGRHYTIALALVAGMATIVTACAPANPNLIVRNPPPKPPVPARELGLYYFQFNTAGATGTQSRYDENVTSVFFQAEKDGKSVNDVKANELRVQENGVNVTPFSLAADHERFDTIADIVFAVDVTTSMGPFIESAKKRLKDFIHTSRTKGYHTRMCIMTFGDYVVKHCSRFFDNNPRDASTETQVSELLNELAQLRALVGPNEDPGWPDIEENPMGALIEAASAQWAPESQRFLILVTDAPFLYSPGKQGKIGERAPKMADVTKAIKDSQMKVFAITPGNVAGYNSPFQNEPGIVQASGGEFFEFKDVVNNRISIDSILDRILISIQTTYKITYTVEKVRGLDATLPVARRDVKVSLARSERGTARVKSVLSSMPSGHQEYQKSWKVGEYPVQADSMQVFMNGQQIPREDYRVNQNQVEFVNPPKPGAQLRFVFLYEATEHNLRVEPITIKGAWTFGLVKVFLNDKEARREDVAFEPDLEGNTGLRLSPSIMAANDPYDIRRNQGLKVKIVKPESKQ